MISYTAKEAKNRLGEVLRSAMAGPVEITNHGTPIVRILSIAEMNKLQQVRNQQDVLDQIKHRISCEVLARFSTQQIREKALSNLQRWKENGTWGLAYEEWLAVLENPDDKELIACMVGLSERSNRLRQSMPYVGLLDKSIVRKLNEEIAA